MAEEVYLGIDTSCYTTSLFCMDRQGRAVAEARRILKVKPGGCGLQQSEMLYQHIRNLPELVEAVAKGHGFTFLGMGVSAKPRPRENSYMPAFLAGVGFARSLAALFHIPLWQISHQENHLEAALWSAQGCNAERFLFLHASGGTTDLLLADKQAAGNYNLQEIGGSLDLHAGQFVDRVGVALGLSFPAGPALEELAEKHTAAEKEAETASAAAQDVSVTMQHLHDTRSANLAASVQLGLAETFARMLRNGAAEHNVKDVILAGGVCANHWIRKYIEEKLARRGIRVWLPENRYSGDNAAGCAAYAWRQGELIHHG